MIKDRVFVIELGFMRAFYIVHIWVSFNKAISCSITEQLRKRGERKLSMHGIARKISNSQSDFLV